MSKLFSAKVPPPPKPVRVPTPDDPDIKAAALEKQRQEDANRKGRRSTDLGGGSGAYARTTLG